MQQAARITDPIGHGLGLTGMLLGAVIGGLLVAGTIATGGLLGVVLVAGGVAMGGLSGGMLARGFQHAMGLPDPTTGLIAAGSPNVWIGNLPAARAGIDYAAVCVEHVPPWPLPLIAQGSKTVGINSHPAARVADKLVCGAEITKGKVNVYIGGPQATVCMIFDAEAIMQTALSWLGLAALVVGAGLLAVAAGAAALAAGLSLGAAVMEGAGALIALAGVVALSGAAIKGLHSFGDRLGPGYGDMFEGAGGFLLLWAGTTKTGGEALEAFSDRLNPMNYEVAAEPGKLYSGVPADAVQYKGPLSERADVAVETPPKDPYRRPSGFRSGIREKVWNDAKNAEGRVQDPLTGKKMNDDEPWDMGHKPGYEFRKHQTSARERGISRQEFLDEYNKSEHYRPELPESNRSHEGELLDDEYFGD